MNVIEYIKHNYDSFSKREKLIADYLLLKKKDIFNMTASEIASITNTSAATVVRFAKKLGYSSLNEMKIKLSISLTEEKNNRKFKYLDENLSINSIINTVKNSTYSIIDETVNLIDENKLNKAINLLSEANTIYIFGVGVSNLVGLDFYYKLSRINKRCIIHSDTHLQIISSTMLREGDVVLAISYSGKTNETLHCVRNAKKNNVPIISLTKMSIENEIEKLSDVTLYVPYVEKSLREGAMTSRISQLAIIDMLFLGIASLDIKDVEEKLVVTREAIKDFKDNKY